MPRLHGQLGSIVAGRGGDVRCSPPAPKSAFRCRHRNDLPLGAEPRQQTSGCCPKVEAKIQDVWQRRDCNDAGMVSGEATIQNVCRWRGRDDSGAVSEASDAPIASARPAWSVAVAAAAAASTPSPSAFRDPPAPTGAMRILQRAVQRCLSNPPVLSGTTRAHHLASSQVRCICTCLLLFSVWNVIGKIARNLLSHTN